eukprot:Gb_19556 [translate_table: standard]
MKEHLAESHMMKSAEINPMRDQPTSLDKEINTFDIRGRPITDMGQTGGWTAACFIFGIEMAERMAYNGIAVNSVDFLSKIMHRYFASAINIVSNFTGISQISAVVGGFLADAYLGRYWTIAIFSIVYLLGLTLLTLSATVKRLMPSQVGCDVVALQSGTCQPAESWQISYLMAALYISATGTAGIRPCVSAFGADQFDEREPNYRTQLDRFFNFFYLFVTIGSILSLTLVVYLHTKLGWGYAFGSLAVAMALSNLIFFAATPLYRHRLPGGSPFTRIAQVAVAAFRKSEMKVPKDEKQLYEVYAGKQSAIKGSSKLKHTNSYSFLDKAAVNTDADFARGRKPSPWRLCTVSQVEELKILIKMLPIWISTILMSTLITVFLTLSLQQGYTMNRQIGQLNLPVTSIPVFSAIFIFVTLSVYDVSFVPVMRRFTGHPRGMTNLQRIGAGLAISVLSVLWAGIFERRRRKYAVDNGFEDKFFVSMPGMSAYWLVIQFCLIGLAEIFAGVGSIEFFYEEAPDAMRSLGTSFATTAGGLGSFLSTFIHTVVKSVTAKNGHTSWLDQNINKGHYDYYYWFCAVLSAVNLIFFLVCAHLYKYKAIPDSHDTSVVQLEAPTDVESI